MVLETFLSQHAIYVYHKVESCPIPLSTVYNLLPSLIFLLHHPLVGLGPVDTTWPWGPKHPYAALLWGLHPEHWGSAWLPLGFCSLLSHLFLICFLLYPWGHHLSYQYPKFPGTHFLQLLHFCDISKSVFSSLVPQIGMFCGGKKMAQNTEL